MTVLVARFLGELYTKWTHSIACASPHTEVSRAWYTVGLFSGTTGAIHSLVGELTDETNQSIVFPIYDICSAIGFVIG